MRTTTWITALALLGTGCEPEAATDPTDPDPTLTDPTEAEEPSPYIYDEEETPVPTAELADVQDALQEAIDTTLEVNAGPVRDSYEAAMQGADPYCPYYYSTADGEYWFDSCTSDQGADFDGYVFALGGQDIPDPYTGGTYDFWYAFGGATVVAPTGSVLEVGGGAQLYTVTYDYAGIEVVTSVSFLQGTFGWDGPEAAGTWMEDGVDPDLTLQITTIPQLGGSSTFLDGGYGGLMGDWAVAWDENVVFTQTFGSSCPDELSGTVGVRAPDGTWYDVIFDGPVDELDVVEGAACDGCGIAYFQGEEVGPVCVDASPLHISGGLPW